MTPQLARPRSWLPFRALSCFFSSPTRHLYLIYFLFMYSEEDLSKAISAYREGKYTSLRKCADAFSVLRSTFALRLFGGVSRSTSYEYEQYLSTAEEKTLIRWISRLSKQGCPISPSLTRDLTFEIRSSRFPLSTTQPPPPFPGIR